MHRLVLVCLLPAVLAQAPPDSFADIARRAEAAIDERPAEAVSLYQQGLKLRPNWAEGWLYLGATLLRLNRLPESREALRKGVELAPEKGTGWAYLGLAEYESKDYERALADILKGESIGLAEQPAFVAAVRYRAALVDLRYSEHAQAIEQVRPLVRAGNDSPQVIDVLGIAALFLDFLPENLPEAKHPLVTFAGRAEWAFLAERADQSGPLFEKFVSTFPSEPGVHYMTGAFLIDQDPARAEAEFRKELALVPGHVLARVQLALILMQRDESVAAEKLAREAVSAQPENALCQVTLGRALMAGDRITEAIMTLEKGEKLAPGVPRTHFYLQQAYQRAGRAADAQREKAEFDRLRKEQEAAVVGRH